MCMSFGERLRKLRKQKDWTQAVLAARLDDTDPSTVGDWEANRHKPQPAKMQRLAEVFEIRPVAVLINLENTKLCADLGCENLWRPELQEAPAATTHDQTPPATPIPAVTISPRGPLLAVGIVAVAACLTAVLLMGTKAAPPPDVSADVERLYADFAREGGYVVLSNPTVYRYVNAGDRGALGAGDPANPYIALPVEGRSRALLRSAAQYTGVGEALTAVRLQALLGRAVRDKPLQIAQSNTIEDVRQHMILLGGWGSNPMSTQIVGTLDGQKAWDTFHRRLPFRVHEGIAYRLTPGGAETAACSPEYEVRRSDGELVPTVECALITKVREPFHNKMRIVVAGINSQGTEAAGRLLTEDRAQLLAWLDALKGGAPQTFQVLFRVPVDTTTARPGTNYQLLEALALD